MVGLRPGPSPAMTTNVANESIFPPADLTRQAGVRPGEGCDHGGRTWCLDRLQCLKCSIAQGRMRAGDAPEQDRAFVICDSGNRGEQIRVGLPSQQTKQPGAAIGPAHAGQCLRSLGGNPGVEVLQQAQKCGDGLFRARCAAACVRTGGGIGVAQQRCGGFLGEDAAEHGRGTRRLGKARPGDDILDDDTANRRGGGTTNRCHRLQGCGLLRDGVVLAEAFEPAAERLQRRDGGNQFAAGRFPRQGVAGGLGGVRYGRDQCIVGQ